MRTDIFDAGQIYNSFQAKAIYKSRGTDAGNCIRNYYGCIFSYRFTEPAPDAGAVFRKFQALHRAAVKGLLPNRNVAVYYNLFQIFAVSKG